MRTLAIWSIISTLLLAPASARAGAELDGLPEDLRTAPSVPPWPVGLTPAKRIDGGAWLAPDMAKANQEKLLFLQRYPALCQATIDGLGHVLGTQCREQRAVDAARCAGECNRKTSELEAGQWRWYELGGLVAGAFVLGYLIGELAP